MNLLTHFGEESCGAEYFMENELFALESTGLIHASFSAAGSSEDNGFIYLTIHPNIQRALQQVLQSEFGVNPLQVCVAVIQGFWRHQQLDDFCGVRLGQKLLNVEEAMKWADCILFSRFSKQVIDYACTSLKEDSNSPTAALMLDGLLLASFLLCDLYPDHLRRMIQKFSTLRGNDGMPTGACILGDIILNLELEEVGSLEAELDEKTFSTILDICARQHLSKEYFAYFLGSVFQTIDNQNLFLPLDTALSAQESNDKMVSSRPELVNVSVGLFKCRAVWEVAQLQGGHVEAVRLIDQQIRRLIPEQKYFHFSWLECQYLKGQVLYLCGKEDKALILCAALMDEYYAAGNILKGSSASNLTASILFQKHRWGDALPLYKRHLEGSQAVLGSFLGHDILAEAHAAVAHCGTLIGDFETAEHCFLAFESIRARLDANATSIGQMWNLCWMYWRWGKYSLAWKWAELRWAETQNVTGAKLMGQTNALLYLCALGPAAARAQITKLPLGTLYEVLEDVRQCQAPALALLALTFFSRACSWMGNHQDAWHAIAAGLSFRNTLEARDDAEAMWKFDLQLLTAAIHALRHNVPLSLDLSSKNAEKDDRVPSTISKKAEAEVSELLRNCWKSCASLAEFALPRTDMGWQYEYAMLLLFVNENEGLQHFLASRLGSLATNAISHDSDVYMPLFSLISCQPAALLDEGLRIMEAVYNADLETTEWTKMAGQVLMQHQQAFPSDRE